MLKGIVGLIGLWSSLYAPSAGRGRTSSLGSNPKVRLEHSPDLAPKKRTSSSIYIRMLLIVRPLEDAWATMQESGLGRRAAARDIGAVGDTVGGRCSSNG